MAWRSYLRSTRHSPLMLTSSAGPSPVSSAARLLVVLSLLAAVSVGCSSKHSATPSAAVAAPSSAAISMTSAARTPPAAASSVASRISSAGLSGKWTGQYSGSYQGTFTLNWVQSSSSLTGTITLSAPAATLRITGTVVGSAIRFGAVGSFGISYTGSVSHNTMSGTYQVADGSGSGGPWSAVRA